MHVADGDLEIAPRPAIAMHIAGDRFPGLPEDLVNGRPRIGSECGNCEEHQGKSVCLQHAPMIERSDALASSLNCFAGVPEKRPRCLMTSSSSPRGKTRPKVAA